MFSDIAPRQLPDWLQDALGFVPIAVLTAIIVPAVIIAPEGGLALAGNARLPAALVAVTMAIVTRSVLATIATGLGALWCLDWLVY
jgi:branched-subunit amino acid transport protein